MGPYLTDKYQTSSIENYLSATNTQAYHQGIQKGQVSPLTSCLTCLDQPVLQLKTKFVSCHTADSKPVKKEVNQTVILPPLVFPAIIHQRRRRRSLCITPTPERFIGAENEIPFHLLHRRSPCGNKKQICIGTIFQATSTDEI